MFKGGNICGWLPKTAVQSCILLRVGTKSAPNSQRRGIAFVVAVSGTLIASRRRKKENLPPM